MRFLKPLAAVLLLAVIHFGICVLCSAISTHYYWTPVQPGQQEQSLMLAGSAWMVFAVLSFPFGGPASSLLWALLLYAGWRLLVAVGDRSSATSGAG